MPFQHLPVPSPLYFSVLPLVRSLPPRNHLNIDEAPMITPTTSATAAAIFATTTATDARAAYDTGNRTTYGNNRAYNRNRCYHTNSTKHPFPMFLNKIKESI